MSIEVQNKIRQNALEMREVITDLHEWEQEMELKEKTKSKFKKEERQKNEEEFKAQKEQEIRQNKVREEQQREERKKRKEKNAKQPRPDLVRDSNTIKGYYDAWGKFNVDEEIDRLEKEEQRAYRPYNPYENSDNNKRAKPKTQITVRGRRNVVSDPTELKDKGNLHFQSLQYDKAINAYTECLKKLEAQNVALQDMTEEKKKLRCVVLSNRAMAQMKNHQTIKALEDATQSLKFNPKYTKSYYRKAECLKKLGKYKESLKDFRMVKTLEPGETKADAEIKKIEAFLAKRARQTRESMVMEHTPSLMSGSKRINITEVDKFEAAVEKKVESNYLDEL